MPPACRDIRRWNAGNNAIMLNARRGDKPMPYAGEERVQSYVSNARAFTNVLRCNDGKRVNAITVEPASKSCSGSDRSLTFMRQSASRTPP